MHDFHSPFPPTFLTDISCPPLTWSRDTGLQSSTSNSHRIRCSIVSLPVPSYRQQPLGTTTITRKASPRGLFKSVRQSTHANPMYLEYYILYTSSLVVTTITPPCYHTYLEWTLGRIASPKVLSINSLTLATATKSHHLVCCCCCCCRRFCILLLLLLLSSSFLYFVVV